MTKHHRVLSAEQYNRLKMATRTLNKSAGGIESAAYMTRVQRAQLSAYQNINTPDQFMPLDVIADLEHETGTQSVTQALCAMAGGYFTPIITSEQNPIFAAHLAKIGKEISDVMHAAGDALDDGNIDQQECSRLIKEIEDAIAALANAKASLEQPRAYRIHP